MKRGVAESAAGQTGRYDADQTWWSPRGTPLPYSVQQRVDLDLLAQMYAVESDWESDMPPSDSATRYAWELGWRNPRVEGSA